MKAQDLFTPALRDAVEQAIRDAERQTSGELRLYVEDHCEDEPLDRAAFIFDKLGMQRTEQRNGVLFYLAVTDHRFAIIGDAGIHARVPEGFWEEIKDRMARHFKQSEFQQGLCEGILEAGRALSAHFPFSDKGDRNELSDEVIVR